MRCLSTLAYDSIAAFSTGDCRSPTTTKTAYRASNSTFRSLKVISRDFQTFLATLCTTWLVVHFVPTEALKSFGSSRLANLSWGWLLGLSSSFGSYRFQAWSVLTVNVDRIFGLGSRWAAMAHIYDQSFVLLNFLALASFHHGFSIHRLKVFLTYLFQKKWGVSE